MMKAGIAAALAALVLAVSRSALAEEAQRYEGQVRETIPAGPFLAGAYGFIWVAVLLYVVVVARRLAQVQGEIEDLRNRLERHKP